MRSWKRARHGARAPTWDGRVGTKVRDPVALRPKMKVAILETSFSDFLRNSALDAIADSEVSTRRASMAVDVPEEGHREAQLK